LVELVTIVKSIRVIRTVMKKWNRNLFPRLSSDFLKIRIAKISNGAKNASIALKRSMIPIKKEKFSLFGLNLPMVELVTILIFSMNHRK
jgi:hypothetical protein